ncbi:MAG: hydroxymethylbilane synthase [Gammaproteobacteria bacterium CG_4_10_14_0_8_um_filter_38_16]|nr:MAG: hydroxymethylbilane synthase [Gammaproteobacteria bacterium CG_4_10_14_0_8_um_filter_38_16]PJA03229.1 MAG: hydroxymethylbilane synthase [Gammaproteobacteria bacterium CG_4_10_14_0_2_um_filter_38_22]PJB10899.1 MAG: hydroxymethylbilane synthase [Gammaproteobacteria bacterium CG_4_9_14_3_um_filter_38_9]
MKKNHIRIATRKSKLALWQAHFIKSKLEEKHPELNITLIGITTEGDQEQDIPLTEIGGKSVFVKALQSALLKNEADIAVHSIKDMSVYPTEKLVIAAICERADARDAFLSNHYTELNALPHNAVVGTSSPRRAALVKSIRPDIEIKLLRGNVDTRLSKLDANEYDAIILAAAGVIRLNLAHRIRAYFPDDLFTPAIGQGAIAIECREKDHFTRELTLFLHHLPSAQCVTAERAVNQIIGGDCHTAIGAHAKIIDDKIQLSAMVGSENGEKILRAAATAPLNTSTHIGKKVADDLLQQGATDLI